MLPVLRKQVQCYRTVNAKGASDNVSQWDPWYSFKQAHAPVAALHSPPL